MDLINPTPMTVVRLEVDGYMRIVAAAVTPNATGLVPVRGGNRQGKTSLINSMLAALKGKEEIPEMPMTIGSHTSEVLIDFGEILVKRKWKRDSAGEPKSSLVVESAQGATFKSPQAILDNLVGRFADPISFLQMKPVEQVKTVLAVLGLDAPLQKLEQQAETEFEARRVLGRDADNAEVAAAAIAQEVAQLPMPETEHDVATLTAHLQSANEHNAKIDAAANDRSLHASRGTEAKRRLEEIDAEIARLQIERDRQTSFIEQARTGWTAANEICEMTQRVDVDPYKKALLDIETVQRVRGRRELAQQKALDATNARALHAAAETRLVATRTAIADLLKSVPFPIDGMAYDVDKKLLTVNGVPFSQTSEEESLRIAAAVAMAGNPPIKVMFARNTPFIGSKSYAQLEEICAAGGWQLWIEIGSETPDGPGVWIEDGHAYGPLTDTAAPAPHAHPELPPAG